jgi:hypothetical protein
MSKIKAVLARFNPKHNSREAMQAVSLVLVLSVILCAGYAVAQQVFNTTLTVTVNTALTFSNSSTNNFANLTPGTPGFATTTLVVATNDVNGWNVTLSGTNKTTGNNNLQLAANAASIPDQTEWVPGGATTTAGNATTTANFTNSGNVLAFRVMTASSSNGTPFLATAWWGANDAASAMWAGIASSTVARQIGNAGSGSYSASNHYNTVQYYLNVASTQQTGAYSAPLVYTATGN